MSYTTKSVVTASAGQREFDIPFPYLDVAHINVKVAGNTAYWSLVNSGRLRLDFAANAGDLVEISRQTNLDQALVKFNNGAVLTSDDLNTAVQQTLFIQQELTDLYNASLNASLIRLAGSMGVVVTDPQAVLDTLTQNLLNSTALANFNARLADIQANANALVTQQTQLSNLTATVNALASFNGTGLQTLINNEQTQRIAGDTALSQTLSLIGAKSGDSTAIILNQSTCKVGPTQSLGEYITGVASQLSSNLAAIQTEVTARTTADSSLASQITALTARVGTAEANITNNYSTLAANDSAQASSIGTLSTRLTSAEALIQTEQTARVNADGAFATQLALLGAKNAGGTAWVLDENKVLVNGGGTSLANRLSGLDAAVGSANAAIATEQTVRANADSALAQSISTLQSTVNGNTATISTVQSVVNGLNARYSVAVDVNGNVAGFLLNSNGQTSSFNIVANVFSIVDPANKNNAIVPFEVSGGVVRIKDAAIQNLSIGSLGSGTYNGQMNMGTGRITFNNGSVMKVMGVGFGTSNQFIEWYGPSLPSIGQCSETNAISYLRVDGAAYFGGSLSAGTLTTKASTSDTSTAAYAETAVFGSAGRQITVTMSYNYSSTATGFYTGDTVGLNNFNTRKGQLGLVYNTTSQRWELSGVYGSYTWIDLYRSYNGGAYTLVASLPLQDSWQIVGVAPIPGDSGGTIVYTSNIGGSLTYSDPNLAAVNRQYKAVLRTRAAQYTDTITQRVSLVCVEQ